ncbi:MAG: DUF3467 domain-containing protein [Bacteroidaceae bacterium]|nr:DUF3467 domain-containing protein [Bacteroidaceae bacterium]
MANEQQNQQLQIELKPDVAQGVYANLAILTHSSSEFILDFAGMMPGLQKAEVRSRVVMAPEHAKRLLFALQDNLKKYEDQFGEIRLQQRQQPRPGSTIAPFNMNPGEA